MDNNKPQVEKHHHHIISDKAALSVGGALLVLTVVTVAIAHVDLGRLNFVIAMLVASVKASLVALFFMNLLYDRRENSVIFGTSFVFLAIFISLTATDLFFRGDVAVKGAIAAPQAKSKLSKPWISTPELVEKGKELFAQQCTSCHGMAGKGDGPAAASLNPRPRDFTSGQGWKIGRKPSQIFKTLKDGLPPSAMGSYATLPVDDRWALVHYVASLGPQPVPTDSPEDLSKAGIDVTQAGGGEAKEAPSIPVEVAMQRMAQPEVQIRPAGHPHVGENNLGGPGSKIFSARCANCHGAQGQGGVNVKTMGVNPRAFLITRPLNGNGEGMKSPEAFRKVVVNGLPTDVMPGAGDLSSSEMQELFQYVRTLAAR